MEQNSENNESRILRRCWPFLEKPSERAMYYQTSLAFHIWQYLEAKPKFVWRLLTTSKGPSILAPSTTYSKGEQDSGDKASLDTWCRPQYLSRFTFWVWKLHKPIWVHRCTLRLECFCVEVEALYATHPSPWQSALMWFRAQSDHWNCPYLTTPSHSCLQSTCLPNWNQGNFALQYYHLLAFHSGCTLGTLLAYRMLY